MDSSVHLTSPGLLRLESQPALVLCIPNYRHSWEKAWDSAVPVFRVLLIAMFFGALIAVLAAYLRAVGRPAAVTRAAAVQLLVFAPLAYGFGQAFGAVGVAIGVAVGMVVTTAISPVVRAPRTAADALQPDGNGYRWCGNRHSPSTSKCRAGRGNQCGTACCRRSLPICRGERIACEFCIASGNQDCLAPRFWCVTWHTSMLLTGTR